MKRKEMIVSIVSLLSVAAFVATTGCKPESENLSGDQTSRDAAGELAKAKKETKEAIDATTDYAYAQKAEYAAKIRAELADLSKQLDQLGAKLESSSVTAKEDAKAKLQVVREKIARLNEKLEGVQSATESTWEEIKAGVTKGYEEVKDSFKQARQWLSEKISP